MTKFLQIIGSLLVAYGLLARVIGWPDPTDFMPIEWFYGSSGRQPYYNIVVSDEPSYTWIYTVGFGVVVCLVGWGFGRFRR